MYHTTVNDDDESLFELSLQRPVRVISEQKKLCMKFKLTLTKN